MTRRCPGRRSGYDQTKPRPPTRKSKPSLSISSTPVNDRAIERTSSASAIADQSVECAATPSTHHGVGLRVVPDETHRLLECPCHTATPLELVALQCAPDRLTSDVIQQMPHRDEVERGIGGAEAAAIEHAGQPARR